MTLNIRISIEKRTRPITPFCDAASMTSVHSATPS